MNTTLHAANPADWQTRQEGRAALIKSPTAHHFALDELASALQAQGMIDAGELADLAEQANAADQSGVEEQLSAEFNHPNLN